MNVEIRKYKIEDTESILEIINYNILNSTALYDYKIRSLENQIEIFNDKLNKGFPIIVATEYCGIKINATGVCIKPPPPTIASINPAKNEAQQRRIII